MKNINLQSRFVSPKEIPPNEPSSLSINSLDKSPDECLDIIVHNQKPFLNDENSDSSSELDVEIEKEEIFEEDVSKLGVLPYSETSFFLLKPFFAHYFLFLWRLSKKVIQKGHILRLNHLQFLSKEQRIEEDLKRFLEAFDRELKKNNGEMSEWSFAKMLFRLFKLQLLLAVFFWTFHICVCFIFSLFIERILVSKEENGDNYSHLIWAMALTIGFVLQYSSGAWGWYTNLEFCTKFRLMLINSLYLKIMRLNNFSVQKANIGKIINIIANDMNMIEFKFVFLIFLVTSPFTLILSIYLLWRKLGPMCLIAIGVIGLIYFIQKSLSSFNVKNIKQKNSFSDQRMKLCNELVQGIRLLKIYAWEMTMKKFIDEIRHNEIQALKKYSYYIYADRALSVNSSYITSLILFFVFYYASDTDNQILTPSLVFAVYQLMEYIRTYQVGYVGYGLSFFFEFKVVLRRVIDILTLKEPNQICTYDLQKEGNTLESNLVLEVENLTAFWDLDQSSKPVLKNINMKIEKGKIYAIIGKVGSGKSSFFNCLLKEIPKMSGSLNFNCSLAYVEQDPFIMHGTVRSNILFFKEFNEKLYKKVLKVCCLEEDLLEFPNKDLSEIGERGLNLSGGQKARLCLARALYSEADLYLLDDPLSALDTKVGKSIFEKGIKKFLKNKTVILSTHQIQFLRDVDYIYSLEDGEIKKQGCFSEFKNEFLNYFEHKKEEMFEEGILKKTLKKPTNEVFPLVNKNTIKLYANQEDEEAQVGISTYYNYFRYSKSTLLVILCLSLFILFEGSKYSLSRLYTYFDEKEREDLSYEQIFIGAIIILIIQIFIAFGKYFCFVKIVLKSNGNIHNKMTECIVRAPTLFFDTHNSGSILNRFSNDIALMDSLLILTIIDFFDLSLYFIAGIIIAGSLNLWFFIPGVVSLFILGKILTIAKPVILGLKKIDLQNKSPIFGFFSSTLGGLSTINVYKRNSNFIELYSKLIENAARANNNFWEVSRGFGFAIESISKITSVIGLFITLDLSHENSGVIGQQLIYLIIISESLQWGLRQAINADSVMNSSLRALKFTELPSEDLLFKTTDKYLLDVQPAILTTKTENERTFILHPLENQFKNDENNKWPNQGKIIFQNVFLKYRLDLDNTLNDLSFEIQPGEKIGVVGRTGAGKSSIIQALFRMVEINKGKIEIDSANIHDIGLHTLRENLTIIPQNSFLFTGSIKRNIDPMGKSTDNEILEAIKKVELKEHIDKLESGINSDMSYAKSVFSAGQMQLLCLARAILRKNKILVLDEATANVDFATDVIIQKIIKEKFASCTIITIAHRLLTIADYDKVLVMDKGHVVEFEKPFLLLTDENHKEKITKNGYFAEMVKSMGSDTSIKILEIARTSYENKKY